MSFDNLIKKLPRYWRDHEAGRAALNEFAAACFAAGYEAARKAPPSAPAEPLSDAEITKIWGEQEGFNPDPVVFARAVLQAATPKRGI